MDGRGLKTCELLRLSVVLKMIMVTVEMMLLNYSDYKLIIGIDNWFLLHVVRTATVL